MIPPCLTLSNIRYVSRVKWSNPWKGVAPSPTPQCGSYRKGSLRVALDYTCQLKNNNNKFDIWRKSFKKNESYWLDLCFWSKTILWTFFPRKKEWEFKSDWMFILFFFFFSQSSMLFGNDWWESKATEIKMEENNKQTNKKTDLTILIYLQGLYKKF